MSEKKEFLLSIVVPVYKEEANITPFLQRTIKVMQDNGYRYEILFCLDPSPDGTRDVICSHIKENENIKLLQFSRRFGQPSCTLAGIFECKGDACIVTDVDLQDPPELIKEMVDRWQNNGCDVVYAQRKTREGEHLIKKIIAHVGYSVINKLGEVKIPVNTGDFRLMDRKVIEALRESKERHGFLRGMVAFVGYKQEAVLFDRDKRNSGAGNYNPFVGSLYIGLNGIICYSKKPLEYVTLLGVSLSAVGGFSFLYYLIWAILHLCGTEIPHMPFSIALILLFGGMNFLILGLLGEYIGRIYDEVRDRQRYIIDEVIEQKDLINK